MSRSAGVLGRLARRCLLAGYPRRFRREFGEEILAFWLEQREAPRYRRRGGGLRYWRDLLRDVTGTGARLRWRPNPAPSLRPPIRRPIRRSGHESPPVTGGRHVFASLLHDLQYSVRFLRASPLFTSVALLTLVVGIGANTAIFGIVNGVLLRPLPYPESDRLVIIWRTNPDIDSSSNSLPDFQAYREQATTLHSVTGTLESSVDVRWEDGARRHRSAIVSAGYFDVFRTYPHLGRTFAPSEDVAGGPDVAVISDRLWRERFGARPDVIGESIPISGGTHEIVGVLAEGPDHPIGDIDVWLPLQEAQVLRDLDLDPNTRDLVYLDVYARLADGSSIEEASDELMRIAHQLNEAEGRELDAIGARAQPLHEATVGSSRAVLLLLLGAVGLLLAIVCANVAGLWLTRVAARTHEVAIRNALGAGRIRVVRQLLTESVLLALVGGLGGIAVADALTQLMLRLAPEGLPRQSSVAVDGNVYLYAVALSTACGFAFGLVPALRAAGLDPAATLRGAGRSSGGQAGRRLQRLLVVAQVAIAVILLSGAALLANSYLRLLRVDAGFEPDDVVTLRVAAPLEDGDTDRVRDFYARLLPRVRSIPGVASASMTYSPPLGQSNFRQTVEAEGALEEEREGRIWVGTVIIGTDYFGTLGVPLLRGRAFSGSDRLGEPQAAIGNEAMADLLWPGQDPLGKRFRITGGISGSSDSFEDEFFVKDWMTVVGVAGNVRRVGLGLDPEPEFYRPHTQMSWPSSTLVVKTERASSGLATELRSAVAEVDPTVPIERIRTLGQLVSDSVAEPRFRLILIGSFGLAACLLAMLGVFAVMTMTVSRHTHEIGLRMALGATRHAVLRGVLADGLGLAAIGVTIGLGGSLLASRLLASVLYEITATDPATYGIVGTAVLLVALLACLLPAHRASRLDPTQALRVGSLGGT